MQNKSNKKSSHFQKKGKKCRIAFVFPKKESKITLIWLHMQKKDLCIYSHRIILLLNCFMPHQATKLKKNMANKNNMYYHMHIYPTLSLLF